jgi:hypothetical protein
MGLPLNVFQPASSRLFLAPCFSRWVSDGANIFKPASAGLLDQGFIHAVQSARGSIHENKECPIAAWPRPKNNQGTANEHEGTRIKNYRKEQ